jgi:hypothetical protein
MNFNFRKDMTPINYGIPCKRGIMKDTIKIKKCIVCGKTHYHCYDSAYGSFQGLRNPHCNDSIAKQKNVKRYGIIALNLIHKDTWEFGKPGKLFKKLKND